METDGGRIISELIHTRAARGQLDVSVKFVEMAMDYNAINIVCIGGMPLVG